MFEKEGCTLVYESSYPDWYTEISIRFYRVLRSSAQGRYYLFHDEKENDKGMLIKNEESELSRMGKVLLRGL